MDCPSGRRQLAERQARSVPPYRPPAFARHIISARCPLPSACPPLESTLRRRVAQRRPTLPAFAPPHRTEPEPEPSPEPGASTAFCISPWHDVMGLPVGWWNSEMPPAGGGCPLGRKVQVGTGTWLLREGEDHAHVPRSMPHRMQQPGFRFSCSSVSEPSHGHESQNSEFDFDAQLFVTPEGVQGRISVTVC